MQSATASANVKRAKMKSRDIGQFDLFVSFQPISNATMEPAAIEVVQSTEALPLVRQPDPVRASEVRSRKASPAASTSTVNKTSSARRSLRIFIVSEEDLPDYSDDERVIVDRTLEALPQTKAWFTYADIKETFTISRATVVRRVKSGVVPGIRFAGDRVLEDGSIRRFTREQVRYLLLAIRRSVR